MPRAKTDVQKKRNCVMVRFTDRELAELDQILAGLGETERAVYIHETAMARVRGIRGEAPKGVKGTVKQLIDLFGPWKALGGKLIPLQEAASTT